MIAVGRIRKGLFGFTAGLLSVFTFAQPAAAQGQGIVVDAGLSCIDNSLANVTYTITNTGRQDIYVDDLQLFLSKVNRDGFQLTNVLFVFVLPEPVPAGGSRTWEFEMGNAEGISGRQLILATEALYHDVSLAKQTFNFPGCNG